VRVFLDANILFSAAKSAGAVRELLALAEAAGHTLCVDAYVAAEAQRNLSLKDSLTRTALDAMLARIDVARYETSKLPIAIAALLPAKDQPVLAAAIRLRCDALVTGDRTHFGPLYGRVDQGVAVHSPRSLAEALGFVRAG
jgi:predicted nucleic acid-binding protein